MHPIDGRYCGRRPVQTLDARTANRSTGTGGLDDGSTRTGVLDDGSTGTHLLDDDSTGTGGLDDGSSSMSTAGLAGRANERPVTTTAPNDGATALIRLSD